MINPTNSKRPNVITITEILKPIDQTRKVLKRILSLASDANDPIISQGIFVLAVSKYENMILDVITLIARAFPEKLTAMPMNVDLLIEAEFSILDELAELNTNKIAYKNIAEILKDFEKITGVKVDVFAQSTISKIQEIKATRNLLIHNDLVVNRFYLDQAGNDIRVRDIGSKLELTKPYITDSCHLLLSACDIFYEQLSEKYGRYTRIKVIKDVWKYLFPTPILPFDDFWEVDEKLGIITRTKKKFPNDSLSNSEEIFLNVWMTHFNFYSDPPYKAKLFMRSLDSERRSELLWFLDVLSDFSIS